MVTNHLILIIFIPLMWHHYSYGMYIRKRTFISVCISHGGLLHAAALHLYIACDEDMVTIT